MKGNSLMSIIIVSILLISGFSIALGPLDSLNGNVFEESVTDEYDGSPTAVDNITIKARTNRLRAVEEVGSGDLDVFLEPVERELIDKSSDETKENIDTWRSQPRYYTLYFNPAHTVSPYECNVSGELRFNPFAIQKLRYAANFLINRSKIVEDIYNGHGHAQYLPFSTSSHSYDRFKDIVDDNGFTAEGDKQKGMEMIQEAMIDAMNDPKLKGELRTPENSSSGYWSYKPPNGTFGTIVLRGLVRFQDGRDKIIEYFAELLEDVNIKTDIPHYWPPSPYLVWSSDPADLEWYFYTGGWFTSSDKYQCKKPAEMYAGWQGFMPGGFVHDPDYKYGYYEDGASWNAEGDHGEFYGNKTLESISKRLYEGQINSIDQYWEYMKKATSIGVEEAVRVFVNTEYEYYVYNKDRIKSAVTDTITGWNDYFTPRTIYCSKDRLNLSQYSSQGTLFLDNWNELGGSGDHYGLQQKKMLMDPGAALHPKTGEPIPFRCDWMGEDDISSVERGYEWYENETGKMKLLKNISVPEGAVDYNTSSRRWERVDNDMKSAVKVKYDVKTGKWHDGHDLTIKDLIANYAFMKEMAYRDGQNDTWYHQGFSNEAKGWFESIVATRWDGEDDTYAIWGNYTSPIGAKVGEYYTEYTFPVVPHQLYEAAQFLVTQNETFIPLDTGTYGWDTAGVDNWIHWLSKSQGVDFVRTLENMSSKDWIPWYLREDNGSPVNISHEQYDYEIDSLIGFYHEKNHVFSSQGPFVAKTIDPEDMYVEFERFDKADGYPFSKHHWYGKMGEVQVLHTKPEDDSISEVSDNDVRIMFSQSMNTSHIPEIEVINGTEPSGWEFIGWSKTSVENDTAVWTHDGWPPDQEYTLQIDNFESVRGVDPGPYTWNFTKLSNEPPKADAGDDVTISIEENVEMNASASTDNLGIVNYTWIVDDEEYYGMDLEYRFDELGVHEIVLRVKDAVGNIDTDTVNITVRDYESPEAIAGEDRTVDEDTEVIFNASGSTDNHGIKSYIWTIEGEEHSGEIIAYMFEDPGVYDVTLNVSDMDGNHDEDSITVTVRDVTSPEAVATEDKHIEEGMSVTFNSSGSSDNVGITNYTWSLDGKTLHGQTLEYTFEEPGERTVYLIVLDEARNWDSDIVKVKVEPSQSPRAEAGENMTVKMDSSFTLDASGSTDNFGIYSYEWEFDDGTTASGKMVEHKFDKDGKHEVKLTVTDEAGNTDTDTIVIIVEGREASYWYLIAVLMVSVVVSLFIFLRWKKR